jgi:hypothetical protein
MHLQGVPWAVCHDFMVANENNTLNKAKTISFLFFSLSLHSSFSFTTTKLDEPWAHGYDIFSVNFIVRLFYL